MNENTKLIEELREAVAGPVFGPDEAGYAAETGAHNLAVEVRPALVVGALDGRDAAAAVRFAAGRGLSVAVQSTGHGAVPGHADGALLINTGRLRELSVDAEARTARIGAGNRWADVLAATAPHGLLPLAGSAPGVGVVGYLLGGGLSPLGRAFGFAADHVRAFELVTADGGIRRVEAAREPDLFWALRGGGGGLGVVTAVEIDLFPVPHLYAGAVYFPGERAADVLHAYRAWQEALPEAACASVALLNLPPLPHLPEPLRGRFTVAVRFAYPHGPEEGARLLAPMLTAAEPIMEAVGELPLDALGMIHSDPADPMPIWEHGDLLDDLPAEAVDALLASLTPEQAPLVLELRALGGAFSRPARHPNALDTRDAAHTLLAVNPFPTGLAPFEALRPWLRGAGLPTLRGANPIARDPETAARLAAIKSAYDPTALFR